MIRNKSKVAILMATYNGEQYLREQIDSIINQSYENWTLYISDDGSSDATVAIINEYAKLYPNIIPLKKRDFRKGAKFTFMDLLDQIDSDLYMFSDQDDIWKNIKVEKSVDKILSIEKNNKSIPIVVHSDLELITSEGQHLCPSFWNYSRIYPDVLNNYNYLGVCNCVTGCTMIFNDEARKQSFPMPVEADMHDWWIALTIAKNGIIDNIPESLILYRQHNTNTVGARKVDFKYYYNKIIQFKGTIQNQFIHCKFLKQIGWGGLCKYYFYKSLYLWQRIIR